MSTIGTTRLAQVLREEGRKQVWLAERTGIGVSKINYIVHGLRASEDERKAIAEALGRSEDELFGDAEPTPA